MLATPKSSLGKADARFGIIKQTTMLVFQPPPSSITNHHDHVTTIANSRHRPPPSPTTTTTNHDNNNVATPPHQPNEHAPSDVARQRCRVNGHHALTHGHNNEARPVTVVNGYHRPLSQAAHNDNSIHQAQRKAMERACDDVATCHIVQMVTMLAIVTVCICWWVITFPSPSLSHTKLQGPCRCGRRGNYHRHDNQHEHHHCHEYDH